MARPTPRKPHPRSLDALFPRPKKPAVKRCARGHRQQPDWRPTMGCPFCALYEETSERIRNHDAKREREEWSARLNVGPVLTHRIVSTGQIVRHVIPPHLQKRRRRRPLR